MNEDMCWQAEDVGDVWHVNLKVTLPDGEEVVRLASQKTRNRRKIAAF